MFTMQMKVPFLQVLLSLFAPIQAQGGCRTLEFRQCVQNKTLVGHVIKNFTVTTPALKSCQHKCFLEHKCVSYNLGPIEGMVRSCELSDADNVTRPGLVVPKEGFDYCPIKHPCSSSPCPLNRLCQPLSSMDAYNCTACEAPLGMEDGRIQDSQINASSFYDYRFYPWFGRLNLAASDIHEGYWSALNEETGEYIQIDLGRTFKLTKVATQGSESFHGEWLTKYSLAYKVDDPTWIDYEENNAIKIFPGNGDGTTVVTNEILVPFVARFVRIIAKEFFNWPTVRAELYGCSF